MHARGLESQEPAARCSSDGWAGGGGGALTAMTPGPRARTRPCWPSGSSPRVTGSTTRSWRGGRRGGGACVHGGGDGGGAGCVARVQGVTWLLWLGHGPTCAPACVAWACRQYPARCALADGRPAQGSSLMPVVVVAWWWWWVGEWGGVGWGWGWGGRLAAVPASDAGGSSAGGGGGRAACGSGRGAAPVSPHPLSTGSPMAS